MIGCTEVDAPAWHSSFRSTYYNQMGLEYVSGINKPASMEKAVSFFQKAENLSDRAASLNLARMIIFGLYPEEKSEAKKRIEKLVADGYLPDSYWDELCSCAEPRDKNLETKSIIPQSDLVTDDLAIIGLKKELIMGCGTALEEKLIVIMYNYDKSQLIEAVNNSDLPIDEKKDAKKKITRGWNLTLNTMISVIPKLSSGYDEKTINSWNKVRDYRNFCHTDHKAERINGKWCQSLNDLAGVLTNNQL